MALETGRAPSGWVLVDARVRSRGRYYPSLIRAHLRAASAFEEFPLPVQPNGRIHELIRLPRDVARLAWVPPANWKLDAPVISVRAIGWFGRTWRMVVRVLRTWLRLTEDERRECGLTIARVLFDLPGSYRTATGFRVRFWEVPYPEWIERFDRLAPRDERRIAAHIRRFARRPRFHLLLAADGAGADAMRETLASLRGQLYREFECTLLDADGALGELGGGDTPSSDEAPLARVSGGAALAAWLERFNAALGAERAGEWVMLLRAGESLPPHALYWFAWDIQSQPRADAIYADDDRLDAKGERAAPRFKPDWSPTHLRSTHYVGSAAVFQGASVAAAGGIRPACCRHGNYDLLLRVADAPGARIAHLPAVLLHRGHAARGQWEDPRWCAAAVQSHLERNGVAAEVVPAGADGRRVRHRVPAPPPLVSLIVPTRDALKLVRGCLQSVLEKTAYPAYEIVVVDNRTTDPETLAYLAEVAGRDGVRVLRYPRRFNYSAINNFAVRHARGEALCLLNNDTEVITPDWLDEMVGHLAQPRVGAVGAKLFYPDERVQHGGVTVGPGGCASHLHLDLDRDAGGYCGRAGVAQELSAVTGACLLTWKRLYRDLGGLNERRLTVAFNDIDYCLRLQEAGWRVIYTPHAELYHHESATRGGDEPLARRLRARREVRFMRRRWRERMKLDPYYNPNLSYRRADFSLGDTPRVRKPWLADAE
jgi:GT2 family glycosyltransferase